MTRYPNSRVYCRVPLDLPAAAPRKPFRLTYLQAIVIGLSIGVAFVAIVFAL